MKQFFNLKFLFNFDMSYIFAVFRPFLKRQIIKRDKSTLSMSYYNLLIFFVIVIFSISVSCNDKPQPNPPNQPDGKTPIVTDPLSLQPLNNTNTNFPDSIIPSDNTTNITIPEGLANPQISAAADIEKIPLINNELKKANNAFINSDIAGANNILINLHKQYPELPPPGILLLKIYAANGKHNRIKHVLDMTTNDSPDDPEAYLILAQLAMKQEEYTAAELLLKEAESKFSNNNVNPVKSAARKKNLLSALLSLQSNLAKIRRRWIDYGQLADKRIQLEGKSADLLRQKGIALFQQNKDAEAAAIFTQADNISSSSTNTNSSSPNTNQNNSEQGLPAEAMLYQLYNERGDTEKAKKYLADALKKYPKSKEVILLSIHSRLREDKLEEAKSLAENLIKNFPDFELATRYLATIALYLNDYQTAENLFQNLIIKTPSDSHAINGLALALCEQKNNKKLQRAIEYARDNVNKNQQNVEYWSTLGWVLYNANQIEASRQALQKAVATGKITSDTAYYLANLEKNAGKTENAKKLLIKALENKAPFVKKRDVTKLLNSL